MSNYIFEGKTSIEAIEKGLKELKVSKDKVNIKVLEDEDKRSFFSILAPRVVKVEMTLKEDFKKDEKPRERFISKEDVEKQADQVKEFLDKFIRQIPSKEIKYSVKIEDSAICVDITGEDINYLIGYRGEVLNSIQVLVSAIANKGFSERARVLLNIEGYREKREKALEELADKISRTVIRTEKSITLEPMSSFERKIIHTRLQESNRVKTYSIGEEPYRKIVVALK